MEERQLERPEPGAGEVLVRVMATAVNPVDAKIRANGSWAGIRPPAVLGYDAAGVVERVGPGVLGLRAGDEVYYTPEIHGNQLGTYAEYNVVPAAIIARKPAGLSFEEAAAIPLAGGTAWQAIVSRLAVRLGETVLIHGGAGGVGSFAVQLAREAGARVISTASAPHLETLRELGAHLALDYRTTDPVAVALDDTNGRGVDAAFDIAGENRVARCLPALRRGGRIACILPPQGDLTLLYQRNQTLHGVFVTRERERLDAMRPLFERREIIPLVDRVLPLERVAEAHRRVESGHGRGKVVLQVSAG